MKVYEANNKALEVWTDATGLDPKNSHILGGLYEYHHAIRESQDVDPTALTTFMILRSTVREYAQSHEFDGLEIVEHPERVYQKTENLRTLLSILNDPECMEEVAAFQESLKASAKTMGLLRKVDSLIDDVHELAYIRRDALLGFKELKVFHFGFGERGKKKPKYNQRVVKFWNMNSVLLAAQAQRHAGITMVMVRDPVDLFSYFCFLAVNGPNITIISDLPDEPHPLHKYMSRGRAQERGFESRAMRLRFPYQLFDFQFDDDGRYHGERPKTGLARTNSQAVPVTPIKKLEPDQILWSIMMFQLLAERYWNQPQKPVALSYTGDGMHQDRLGRKESDRKELMVPGHAFLAPLTRADMNRKKLKHVWEYKPTGQNNWMEDRYGHLVPEEAFNLIGTSKKNMRILDGSAQPRGMVPKGEIVAPLFNTNTFGWRNKDWDLSAIEPTIFGTPEKMESDRRFIARVNQAVIIEAEAAKEFRSRQAKVSKWYEKAVKANVETLLKHVALGTFESEKQDHAPRKKQLCDFDNGVPQPGDILHQYIADHGPFDPQVKLYTWGDPKCLCYRSKKQATVWSHFSPMTPRSLADLCGCKVEDLPDVLQHWYRNERYAGNEILDRTDPMDWKCENPWRSLQFNVVIGIAKSEFNRLLKQHKIPKRTPDERSL